MAGHSYSPTARKRKATKRASPGTRKRVLAGKRQVKSAKRAANGQFLPGKQPKVKKVGHPISGRAQALRELDEMLLKGRSCAILSEALQDELKRDPIGFFKTIVMPLIPRESLLRLESGERLPVRICFGNGNEED